MVNAEYFRAVKAAAEGAAFQTVTGVTDEQIERQRHVEFAVRFLIHTFIPYDGLRDVEEYFGDGAIQLARRGDAASNFANLSFCA